jgi:hypothetical protein
MKIKWVCTAAGAALIAVSSVSFAQSTGSIIGNGQRPAAPNAGTPIDRTLGPSTGTSADNAGAAGTTAPRAPDTAAPATSVGTSGAQSGAASSGSSSGRCDTLIGGERTQCLREQASTGTAGPTSSGMGSGSTR